MYYEEQWVDGALCWRTSPDGAWTRYTANELAHRYESAEKRASDAQATVEALQKKYDDLLGKYRQLVDFYDKHHGTPCEQIRHQQQVEALQARVRELEESRDAWRASQECSEKAYMALVNQIPAERFDYDPVNVALLDGAKEQEIIGRKQIADLQAALDAEREKVKGLKEWQRVVVGTGTDQEAVVRMAATEYTKTAVQCWKDENAKLTAQLATLQAQLRQVEGDRQTLRQLVEVHTKQLTELTIIPIGCSREQELRWTQSIKDLRAALAAQDAPHPTEERS